MLVRELKEAIEDAPDDLQVMVQDYDCHDCRNGRPFLRFTDSATVHGDASYAAGKVLVIS